MKLHIFGDSHVWVLNQAWREMSKSHTTPFQVSLRHCHGGHLFDFDTVEEPDLIRIHSDRVKETPPMNFEIRREDINVFSSLLHTAPIYRHPAWKTFCPWEVSSDHPGMHPVSTQTIHAFVEHTLRRPLELVSRLQRAGYRLAVVEAPRPLARTPRMHGVHADVLRVTDQIHRSFIRDRLQSEGIPLIEVPAETHQDGLTTDAYSHESPTDPHHGNQAFGMLMMSRVIAYAEQP